MKNILLILSILLTNYSMAQVPMAMPPDANAFYDKAMPVVKPQLKNFIMQIASLLKNRRPDADSLSKALQNNSALKKMSNDDIDGIATLIMVQASKDADEELKKMVLSMSNNKNAEEASNNQSNNKKTGSPEEMNDRKQLMLQMIMNRKSKIAEEISLAMKRLPGDKENIINNLK